MTAATTKTLDEMRQQYANLCALFGEKVFQSRMINEETDQLIMKLKKMNAEMFTLVQQSNEKKEDDQAKKVADQLVSDGQC